MKHILRCHEIIKTDFVRGEGCYLYDVHGKKYIDFEAGIWATALGHSHPRINQTIRTQIDQLMHLGTRYPNLLTEEAAVAVLGTVGLAEGKCTFLSSGSEAVEFGVQVARRLMGRPLLLTLAGSFMGSYGSAGKTSSDEWYMFEWSACAACQRSDGCQGCSRLEEIPFERIGAMVFGGGNAHGLVKLPPPQLVRTLVSRVEQQQGLYVANEITTGMGRTGAWQGFQHYAPQPDIVALGKGLGNGYPVSAIAMGLDVAQRLESGAFRYVQSHQNDPLGSAVAKEVIAVMREEELVERSRRVGALFLDELKQLARRHAAIKEARGRGLMIVMEFEGESERWSVASLYHTLLERGFVVGISPAANVMRFYPALTIGENDIAQLLENLEQVLKGA